MNLQTIKISGQLHTRAAFEPATFDTERGTVEVVWTTGARGLRTPWFGERFYEELEVSERAIDLSRLNNGAPLLNAHNGYGLEGVIGVVERAWIANGQGRALVRFSDRPEVKPIRDDVKDGIIRHLSVGYSVQRYEKIEDGEEEIPVYRATRWTPAEISFVSMGFDDLAVVRSGRPQEPMEVVIETREETEMENEDKQKPADDAAAKVERERAAGILATVKRVGLPVEMAEKLIADGTPLDQARALIIDEVAKRAEQVKIGGPVRIEAGEDERDKRVRGVTAMAIHRSGFGELIRQARESKRYGDYFKDVSTDPGEFRGMSLLDVARDVLERSGVRTRGMDKMEVARRALTFRSTGAQSTSDFAVLFENALHKMMLGAYVTAPDTWRLWCATDTVSDFRDHLRFRNGSFGIADELPEGAEYKRKQIPDGQKVSINTQTYGNKIALTRQAIVNDDMGSFTDLATRFGRMFGLTLEVNAYKLLTANSGLGVTFNGNPFFHSTNANINTTGSALGIAGLEADRHVLARQKDISGNEFLDLRPAVLIVSTELGGTARTVNEMEFDDTDNKYHKPNRVRGLFRTVVDTPRLTGARRYMLADPNVYPAFKMVFLEGGETPVLESEESRDIDGTEWRVRFDAKAVPFDPKVAITNAGA